MVRKLGFVLAALAIVLTGLGAGVAAAQQPQEQARTFVGAIAGLENIGAMFVVIVAPDRRAAAFIGRAKQNQVTSRPCRRSSATDTETCNSVG